MERTIEAGFQGKESYFNGSILMEGLEALAYVVTLAVVLLGLLLVTDWWYNE